MSRVSRGSGIRRVVVLRWMPPCGGIPVEGGYLGLTKKTIEGLNVLHGLGISQYPQRQAGGVEEAMWATISRKYLQYRN